jgi:uncharacterized protein (TIGR02145 family)
LTATGNAYTPPAPTIASVSPDHGLPTENKSITITGTNLDTAYQVFIDKDNDGDEDAGEECNNANIDSNTQITCDTPTATAGTYDVVIKTWGGTTKPTTDTMPTTITDDDYTYELPIPVISNLANTISTSYGTTQGTVTATTDINANCKWSLTDQTYTSMTNNFSTGQATTSHSTTVTGLTSGLNTIHISCANPSDNSRYSANETTTVTIDDPPQFLAIIVSDNSITTLQGLTSTLCSSATFDSTANGDNANNTATLYDSRDNRYYNVRKMADNKCWMITNLAYAYGNHYTSGNGSSGWTTSATSTAYYTDSYNDTGVTQFSGTRCPKSYATSASNLDGTECGFLYNWFAATAGTGTAAMTSGNATASICPVGWHLPTGGSSGEFRALNILMSSSAANWTSSGVWRGAYSGYFNPGYGLVNQGSHGYYWSSTAGGSMGVYSFYFVSGYVYPENSSSKYVGFAVRCVTGS